jgi:hypothetical protein
MRGLDELPLFLTIEEVADCLRRSRGAIYEQARVYRESGGRRGLPNVRVGPKAVRVPRQVVIDMADKLVSPFDDGDDAGLRQ